VKIHEGYGLASEYKSDSEQRKVEPEKALQAKEK
jgi:hypothetical protein